MSQPKQPPMNDTQRAIMAVMQVAKDLAEGRLSPADVEGPAIAQCEALFGRVAGVGDPLWELQCDVARRVLAAGGVPANELAEWLAVQRLAEGGAPPEPSWIERALAEGADDDEDEHDHSVTLDSYPPVYGDGCPAPV